LKNDNKISALLITFNEVNHIDDVINNIDFANEIIVIDSFSNDGTFEKLLKFKHVKTIQHPFKNFADQRNYALNQAKFKWVLFIDADERITPKLKDEILKEINIKQNTVAFKFKRLFIFKNKKIRFSGFQTDKTYRLFKKGHIVYNENKIVHELPIINGSTKVLKNKMIHYSFKTGEQYKTKMERYASLKALELYNKGGKASIFHFTFRPLYKFLVNYIIRLGILDGKEGFQLCYLGAYGVYYRYCELQKLWKTKS
jgi:glycosyltransferase involved in cell wall biosynthesis